MQRGIDVKEKERENRRENQEKEGGKEGAGERNHEMEQNTGKQNHLTYWDRWQVLH
jgi:hypothetical protein